MKQILLAALCSFGVLAVSAQQVQGITVSASDPKPVEVTFDCCKVIITPSSVGNERMGLTVEVENEDRDKHLILFGHSFTERDLKRHRPSIRFDKKAYGLNSRQIEVCKGLREGEKILQVAPTRSGILQYDVDNVERMKLDIPVYLAKHKERKFLSKEKYLIMAHPQCILNVNIEWTSKLDELYDKLSGEYDALLKEMEEKGFCPRRSHRVSLEKQQEPYEQRIQALLEEIASVKSENRWSDRSEQYQRFKGLRTQLEEIDFKVFERSCGRCGVDPPPPHNCPYCHKSADDVYRQLNTLYMKLDNGRTTKDEAVRQANALNAAWSRCPNFRANDRVNRVYNNILNHR